MSCATGSFIGGSGMGVSERMEMRGAMEGRNDSAWEVWRAARVASRARVASGAERGSVGTGTLMAAIFYSVRT